MSANEWRKAVEVHLAASNVVFATDDWQDVIPFDMEVTVLHEVGAAITSCALRESSNNGESILAEVQVARLAYGSQGIDEIRAWETSNGLELEIDLHDSDNFTQHISYRGDYTIVWKY